MQIKEPLNKSKICDFCEFPAKRTAGIFFLLITSYGYHVYSITT